MRSTISIHYYVDIGTLQENVCLYAEGLHMLNGCLVSYVKLLIVQSNVLVHDIKH